ncbi:MAG: CvpA family protein [Bacteroidales bacterium]|nr:CvpA family protein [Bacteroidales bacterium]
MNILDIILLLCLVWAVVQGLRKGFITQVIAIISIVFGVWASARFTNVVCAWLAQWISGSEQVLKVVAFTLILVVVFLVLAALGKALEGIIRLVMLGWLNKLLGVVFSLLKCLLILGLIILAFNSLNSTIQLVNPEYLADSVLYGPIRDLANSVFPYVKEMITLK